VTAHTHSTFVAGCYRCDLSREEVIAEIVNQELWVCQDCLIALANADYTSMDLARETAVRAGLTEWARQGYRLMPGDNFFGYRDSTCDCCGTPLAGDRHQAWATK
jgi:hypothetical protein